MSRTSTGRAARPPTRITWTWTYCYPFDHAEVRPVALTLSGSGGAVAGELDLSMSAIRLPVSGTFLGGTLTLGETAVRHDNSELRLLTLTAKHDEFGRLRGTPRYRHTYFRHDGPARHTDYESELWQVVSFRP